MAAAHLELLADPVAVRLLASALPARLAYCWTDGTPRVVPIAFHWDGTVFTFGTPPHAPKVAPIRLNPHVALTIDDDVFPYKVLLVRGTARVDVFEEMVPEYAAAATRYLGPEGAAAWLEPLRAQPMARIRVSPTAVRILDFETRFPSAMSA
jgi:nitroimidazol reductase NimA-like FMN-containing flavoprotein (pyridoxamine 5'-phosphate oxidase superfamily)